MNNVTFKLVLILQLAHFYAFLVKIDEKWPFFCDKISRDHFPSLIVGDLLHAAIFFSAGMQCTSPILKTQGPGTCSYHSINFISGSKYDVLKTNRFAKNTFL